MNENADLEKLVSLGDLIRNTLVTFKKHYSAEAYGELKSRMSEELGSLLRNPEMKRIIEEENDSEVISALFAEKLAAAIPEINATREIVEILEDNSS